jgi:hypothetical protein
VSNPNDELNYEYYAVRAAIERAAANNCEDPRVAAIHLEMAKRYVEQAVRYSDGTRPNAADS